MEGMPASALTAKDVSFFPWAVKNFDFHDGRAQLRLLVKAVYQVIAVANRNFFAGLRHRKKDGLLRSTGICGRLLNHVPYGLRHIRRVVNKTNKTKSRDKKEMLSHMNHAFSSFTLYFWFPVCICHDISPVYNFIYQYYLTHRQLSGTSLD